MNFVIDTYIVTEHLASGGELTYRVPQIELNAFVSVLNFNRREYTVRKEPSPLNPTGSGGTSGGLPSGWKIT